MSRSPKRSSAKATMLTAQKLWAVRMFEASMLFLFKRLAFDVCIQGCEPGVIHMTARLRGQEQEIRIRCALYRHSEETDRWSSGVCTVTVGSESWVLGYNFMDDGVAGPSISNHQVA